MSFPYSSAKATRWGEIRLADDEIPLGISVQERSRLWTCDPAVLEVEAVAEFTARVCGCGVED